MREVHICLQCDIESSSFVFFLHCSHVYTFPLYTPPLRIPKSPQKNLKKKNLNSQHIAIFPYVMRKFGFLPVVPFSFSNGI